jgi:hypothetical protein
MKQGVVIMLSIKRDWELIENDLLCILEWYADKCAKGIRTSPYYCSKDTNIPRRTIRTYINAFKKYKKGEYESWWLDCIAEKYGYEIYYLEDKKESLWVYKIKDKSNTFSYEGWLAEYGAKPLSDETLA